MKMISTVQKNKTEIDRIKTIIENHCLCVKLIPLWGNSFRVKVSEGFTDAESHNTSKRKSLIDIAMHLEKLWIHSGIKPLKERIELVKQYRIDNKLEA